MKALIYFLFMILMSIAAAAQPVQPETSIYEQIDEDIIVQTNLKTGDVEWVYNRQKIVCVYDSKDTPIGVYLEDEEGELIFWPFL